MPTIIEAPRRRFSDPRPFLTTEPGESVYRNVPNLEAAEPVPTLSVKTPHRKDIRRYLRRHEPVLIRSEFLEQSVPVQRWSDPGYLKHKAGDSVVTITQGLQLDNPPHREMTFAAYLDALAQQSRNDRQIYMRLRQIPTELEEDIDDLVQMLKQLSVNRKPVFGKRDLKGIVRKPRATAFIGRHSYTDSHEHGGLDAFLVQVTGMKEVLFHQPTDHNYRALYVGSRKNWSPVRFFNPDLEKYPLFQHNKPVLKQLSVNRKPVFGKRDLKGIVRKPRATAFIGRHSYTDSHEHGGLDAFLVQVTGMKEVLFHQPTDHNYRALYVGSRKNWSPVRFFNPDLEKYPLFQHNKPVYTQVRAGELLYIPDGWFHSVASQDDGVNVTLTYFFPPTHYDLSAATTWAAFKRGRRDGTLKQRSLLYARMLAEPKMLRSFVKRRSETSIGPSSR